VSRFFLSNLKLASYVYIIVQSHVNRLEHKFQAFKV